MNERIKELMEYAVRFRLDPDSNAYEAQVTPEDLEVFAELIVKSILDRLETERDYYANPGTYQFLEYYTKMSAKEDALRDAISMIRSDFGVKE